MNEWLSLELDYHYESDNWTLKLNDIYHIKLIINY